MSCLISENNEYLISEKQLQRMFKKLKDVVVNENEIELTKWLGSSPSQKKGIDIEEYEWIEKALIGKWHSQHEDLVNTIYLSNLIDDRFVDPILDIAFNKDIYRSFDGELESTLRKCVHALKTINSLKSKMALKKLVDSSNSNVQFVLKMYE